jgi:GAF domain-containing protein
MNNYEELTKMIGHLLEGERNFITNAANFSAIIFNEIDNLNWVGFYIFNGRELVLGPFQGRVACVRIALDKGVCGKSATDKKTITVDDVDKFPGHIACDSRSKSEIVIPIIKNDEIYAVLDIDSPILNRFDLSDKEGLEKMLKEFLKYTDLQDLKEIIK